MATAAMARTLTETVAVEPTLQMKLQYPTATRPKNLGMMNKLKNRLRLDPSRALEPARKKIATIEAQRIMSVFEDAIMKSEIVTLMPFIVENLERFRITLGTELSELIEQHAVILNSYEEIKQALDRQMKRNAAKVRTKQVESRSPTMSPDDPEGNQMLDEEAAAGLASPSLQSGDQSRPQSKGSARGSSRASSGRSGSRRGSQSGSSRPSSSGSVGSQFSMDSQMERTVRSLTMVAQQLNTSCKNVIRAFQINPSAMNTIKHEYSKRGVVSQEFITYMNELKDIILNKLLTTPEEEKERMEYLQEISKRERNNAAVIEKLETELKAAQDDKDEEVSTDVHVDTTR